MDNNKKKAGASTTTKNFDHLFGPKDSSFVSSSTSTDLFGSIFPPPPPVEGRGSRPQQVGSKKFGAPGTHGNKGESSNQICNKNTSPNYQNDMMESSYYSSSIYYGGQERYSSRNRTTEQPHHVVIKKDRGDGTSGDNDSNSVSRGNWWQGSLYY